MLSPCFCPNICTVAFLPPPPPFCSSLFFLLCCMWTHQKKKSSHYSLIWATEPSCLSEHSFEAKTNFIPQFIRLTRIIFDSYSEFPPSVLPSMSDPSSCSSLTMDWAFTLVCFEALVLVFYSSFCFFCLLGSFFPIIYFVIIYACSDIVYISQKKRCWAAHFPKAVWSKHRQ